MSTVFELPDQLDLPESDQSQPDDAATCDVLAAAAETTEESETVQEQIFSEAEDQGAWSDDDMVEITETVDKLKPELATEPTPSPGLTADASCACTTMQPQQSWSVSVHYDDQCELLERIR